MDEVDFVIRRKQDILNRFLEDEYALVHVNTTDGEVEVPDYLKTDGTVTLKLSRWFKGAMEVTKERVKADLLFKGAYTTCIVPLNAIWGLTSAKGESLIWPEAVPSAIREQIVARAKQEGIVSEGGEEKEEVTEKAPEVPTAGEDSSKSQAPNTNKKKRVSKKNSSVAVAEEARLAESTVKESSGPALAPLKSVEGDSGAGSTDSPLPPNVRELPRKGHLRRIK